MEEIYATHFNSEDEALSTVLSYISRLSAGKSVETFGYVSHDKDMMYLSSASKKAPKVFLALQYVVKNFFDVKDVIAVRLGKGLHRVAKCDYANSSCLIHYESDEDPAFR